MASRPGMGTAELRAGHAFPSRQPSPSGPAPRPQAYEGVLQLVEARGCYEELCVVMCVVPATISNNVPGTDFSLGSDTAVNAAMEVGRGPAAPSGCVQWGRGSAARPRRRGAGGGWGGAASRGTGAPAWLPRGLTDRRSAGCGSGVTGREREGQG